MSNVHAVTCATALNADPCDCDATATLNAPKTDDRAENTARACMSAIREKIEQLATAGEDERDAIRDAIQGMAYSITVRCSQWFTLDTKRDDRPPPDEFEILVAGGGPAARVTGDLDDGDAVHARLEKQDWFQPWTAVVLNAEDQAALDAFVAEFYFEVSA